ncbi:uncharacterized protein BXZ73DRAFT_52796 [Epithele typhae]|uniref:uncharacterized protein n=1 Tax=Epithele typhae TaxID=378194 RepID=UPI0020085125|nr:uncharacterized protein BXZ73DRAFT_52796 [Epithele typhae]KAH9918701.1 hypothetical protein BXZ73DRAFT_52796 [Epithele typhae]
MPAPFSTPHVPVPLPALYLYPLNDSFVPKHISLVNSQRVKIGRQTNAKTVPAERNGYFDSKVLSRQHAEVWEENGKIYIKDVKSSNGTFINGERLSAEGLESEPFELKTDDIVEFGIDIVGEDNKTIVHHKVAARVVCVFTELDAQAAQRAEAQAQQQGAQGYMGGMPNQPGAGNSPFNFGNGQGSSNGAGPQRRPTLQPQGLVGMGGMGGGNVRVPGKSGLTFDHILSRLQGELQKSRETGAELHSLSSGLAEIHDTLGGSLPSNLQPYPPTLPPVMPAQVARASEEAHQRPASEPSSTMSELQSQLQETQRSLAEHVDKVRTLENMLTEHDAIKQEVGSLRAAMEERKREMELFRLTSARRSHDQPEDGDDFASDDDDTRSISTVTPHELERVDEEDEEQIAAEEEEEQRRSRDELGRPRTPEPTGMGMTEDDEEQEPNSFRQPATTLRPTSPSPPASAPAIPDELTDRLNALAKQLEMALELSRSLEAQHATAQSTISVLESKVASLENLVQDTQTQVQSQVDVTEQLVQASESARAAPQEPTVPVAAVEEARKEERESLTSMFAEWKKNVEGKWSSVHEDWTEERERLRRARDEWESRMRAAEETVSTAATKVENGLMSLASFQAHQQQKFMNGNAKPHSSGGLVTPPSPRSLSAESTRPRNRRKRAASRGRTRSRSISPSPTDDGADNLVSLDATSSESSFPGPRRRSPWSVDDSSDSEGTHPSESGDVPEGSRKMPFPITPTSVSPDAPFPGAFPPADRPDVSSLSVQYPLHQVQTVFGVTVLLVAAAAVVWRVKPEVAA